MRSAESTHDADAAFSLEKVKQQFGSDSIPVFYDLTLSIPKGKFVTIVGPSGCGKSTILRLAAGLQSPTSGIVKRGALSDRQVGFVFQHPTLLPWRTAEQNLRLPLELGPANRKHEASSDARHYLHQLLAQVGLSPEDARKRPTQMSGGMQMRLSLARALVTEPQILLLDEPFAAVDDFLRMRLQEDIRRLHDARNLTTVLVTHNLQEAIFLSDRVIVLSGKPAEVTKSLEIAWSGPRDVGFRNGDQYVDYVRQLSASLLES